MEALSAELSDKMGVALAKAQTLRATMTRDQAFELLEAAREPGTSFTIAEYTARYAHNRGTDRPETGDWVVAYAAPGCQFTVFIKPTLQQAVTAALAHEPECVAPQMEAAA